jgi:DNA polymerase
MPERNELDALRRGIADYVEMLAASGLWAVTAPAPRRAPAPSGARTAAAAPDPPGARPAARPSSPVPSAAPPAAAPDFFAPDFSGLPVRALEEIRGEIGECTRCKLHRGRTHIVFGEGNPKAEILFIGEGPGEEEDRQARPFVGRAGQLLTKIIQEGMKLRREDVYIANIVKCRPPANREPERDEVAACSPFLLAQIRSIGPKVIVTLGRPATSTLLGRPVPITRVRGAWQDFHGIPLMPTYHPAYVLRQYTPQTRREVWDDMKQVLRRIGGAPS